MIHRIVRYGLSALLLTAFLHRSAAMDPERLLSQYIRDRWGSDRGLPGEVYAITQTSDGYLWIGTERGLFRFDGQTFHSVTDQGSRALPITQVLGLAVDAQGNLIVRLPERNLLRYANDSFENTLRSLQPRELAVTAMISANDRSVLLAGLTNGTLRYSDGRFEQVVPVSALPPSPIISLAQSSDGKIWLGTRDAGLFYSDHGRVTAVPTGLPSRKINSILVSGADVWIGTDAGVARWNGTAITKDGVLPALRRASVLAMLKDRQGNLWIGTKTGLIRVSAGGVASQDSLQSKTAVNTLFEDREGNLWSGGPRGIERLRDGSFATFGRPEGFPSDRNGPVWVDSEGRTWFAPIDGGLYWLRKGQIGRITQAALDTAVVYSIAGGKDGLWVGRRSGELTHLYSERGTFVAKNYFQSGKLPQNSVYSVYESRDGLVWAGTLNGGLIKLQDGRITKYSATDGLESNTVTSILEGAGGTMWFGTPNGLKALSAGRWRGYTVKDGLPSDDITCLEQDSQGVVWIGTSEGLAFLSAGEIKALSRPPEALKGQISGVAEDRTGWLWVVTSKEVLHVERNRLLSGALADDLYTYGVDDGLRSVGGVKRQKSVIADPSGRIWLSMDSGLSVIDPSQLKNSVPAIVQIRSITADSDTIDFRNVSKLAAPPRRLTFSFSGLSLRNPERVRFRYRLDAYDRNWSVSTTAHEATYTQLPPGSYRFRLIASNSDGVWNTAEIAIGLEISPFFWQAWWFRMSIVLTLLLGVLGLYRLRLHQLTAQLNLRFAERLDERTRIAQDLHDTLLQGFLAASLRLHVTLDGLPEGSPVKQQLAGALELITQVIDEGRNAVSGLRSPDGRLDLPLEFSKLRDQLGLDEVAFRVTVDGRERSLHPVLRDQVFRLGREALVNAAQHSRATRIEVELQYTDKQLRLVVRDNGCGINPQVLQSGREGHWGLSGMRERAEKIGGRLRVLSSASAGTEVELSVPSRVAFQSKSPAALRT